MAEIAARAGLAARTFFRHLADEREVLFDGSADLRGRLVDALGAAPAGAAPLVAVAAALDTAAEVLGGDQEFSHRRQSVIDASQAVREALERLRAVAGAS